MGVPMPHEKIQNIYALSLLNGLNLMETQTKMISFSPESACKCALPQAHLTPQASQVDLPALRGVAGPVWSRCTPVPALAQTQGPSSGTPAGKRAGR